MKICIRSLIFRRLNTKPEYFEQVYEIMAKTYKLSGLILPLCSKEFLEKHIEIYDLKKYLKIDSFRRALI